MNPPELPPLWSELLNGWADETLTAEQERQLADLLRADSQFRQEYVRFCQLVTLLTWQSAAGSLARVSQLTTASKQPSPQPSRRFAIRFAGWAAVAASTLVVMVVSSFVWFGREPRQDEQLGTLTVAVGTVGITRGDGPPIWISSAERRESPWSLESGDRIQTERASSATLTLPDQTAIRLHPESKLGLNWGSELTGETGLAVRLLMGRVEATVTPRRAERALKFVTSLTEVRVLGTELEVLADGDRTEVAVHEGRVRVTRLTDGSSADIGGSQFLSVTESGRLSAQDLPQAPDRWSVDFEQGLPTGWTGQLVRDGLPVNSHGAAGAVPVPHLNGLLREVGSPTEDNGLFRWHANSVLHITFRIRPPEWFHVYLFARPYDRPGSAVTYCSIRPDLWQTSAGQWRTIHIPLSEFDSIPQGQAVEPTLGRIPIRIVCSGQGGPKGIVIDRIWVDRQNASKDDSAGSR